MWAVGVFMLAWTNNVAVRIYYTDIEHVWDPHELSWVQVQGLQWGVFAVVVVAAIYHMICAAMWKNESCGKHQISKLPSMRVKQQKSLR